MPRGDTRTLPIAVPLDTWESGSHLYFTVKPADDVDDAITDSTAVVEKMLSDSDITSTDATNKNYLLTLEPDDTNSVTPGVYRAEIEFVNSAASNVITYPDPHVALWFFEITGDVGRRTA